MANEPPPASACCRSTLFMLKSDCWKAQLNFADRLLGHVISVLNAGIASLQTLAGSLACAVFGFAAAAAYVLAASWLQLLNPPQTFRAIIAISGAASLSSAVAESLPVGEWDNVIISITAAAVGRTMYGC